MTMRPERQGSLRAGADSPFPVRSGNGQTRTVPSLESETRASPSGVKATSIDRVLVPGDDAVRLSSRGHRATVYPVAVTSRRPEGSKAKP